MNRTIVHVAAMHGAVDVLRFLMRRKPDLEARNILGNTPLHSAAAMGQLCSCQFLLAERADVQTARNLKNMTPLELAENAQQLKLQVSANGNLKSTIGFLKKTRGRRSSSIQSRYVCLLSFDVICHLLINESAHSSGVDHCNCGHGLCSFLCLAHHCFHSSNMDWVAGVCLYYVSSSAYFAEDDIS